ncbi:hypothetical protein [Jiella sp. M17.18]|uniref:hypothetical protein n=1 Tax=Jiella sp. M17.18 TaxID=3234247 RepID=UPI0034DFFD8F
MTDWRRLEAAVDEAAANAFGEKLELRFYRDFKIDPDRLPCEIRAVLHFGGGIESYRPGKGFHIQLPANQGELILMRSAYEGPMPAEGDYVVAMDRAGAPEYKIKSVSAAYSDMIVATVTL